MTCLSRGMRFFVMHTPVNRAELVIVGLARNCARTLERDLRTLQRAAAGFAKVQILVVESDSTDATLAVLDRLAAKQPHVRYASLGTLAPQHPVRTDRIAVCRNHYLDELQRDPRYATAHYVVVADLDGANRDLRRTALESCWRSDLPWDVCTANQRDAYYDVWALRHPQWCPEDCWRQYRALRPIFGHQQSLLLAVHSRMMRIEPHAGWIEVDSAFGGLALYRRDVLLSSVRYSGIADAEPVCEHVPFHTGLRAQGVRIFINPALINARRTPHSGRKRWHVRARRRVDAFGRQIRYRLTGR